MKFLADGMLGKLTRWLRILGHDVKYSTEMDDSGLVAAAKKERRVLLTRDLELYKQATAKDVAAFYFEGQTGEENLAELSKRFATKLVVDMSISRCPMCNARVRPLLRSAAKNMVEKNTFLHYRKFWKCPKCGQIYWQGAHWVRIRKTLEEARKRANS